MRHLSEHVPPRVWEEGYNFGATAIAHGSVVARDLSQSVSGEVLQTAQRKSLGVALPAPSNVRMLTGIYSSPAAKALAAAAAGEITVKGLAFAKVYVPPLTVLAGGVPIGTPLVLGSEWNSTDDDVDFTKTISTVAHSGVLEPVLWATGTDEEARKTLIQCLPNPVAVLREALTGHATAYQIQTAVVELIGPHRWLPFHLNFAIDVPATASRVALRALGPGVITGVHAQILTGGTTSGGTIVDVKIHPVGEWNGSAESKSVFQTDKTILIPNDVSDTHAPVYGCGCDLVGDIDPDNDGTGIDWGTSARQGLLLATEAARQFPALAMISIDLTVDATSPANLIVGIDGGWY